MMVCIYRLVQERAADVFRAVIATNRMRLATPLDVLLQRPDHSSGW